MWDSETTNRFGSTDSPEVKPKQHRSNYQEKESKMKATIRNSIIFMGLVLAGVGSSATAGYAAPTGSAVKSVGLTATVPTGAALYSNNCEGCHGPLLSSAKLGADSTRIQNAITDNSGGMGFLATLTATEIQAIVTTIAPVPTGAALYQSNCLSCHGGLSTTVKAGADSIRIQNAIANNIGGMGYLSSLAPLQEQAVASALTVAPTGTLLYVNNCAGCHGVIAASTKTGADFSRIQNAIISNTGGMGFLATLLTEDIQAIAAVLTAP
jgi:mono/diheme cytochrome c family protein